MSDALPITCDQCQERLEEFALGELIGIDAEQVTEHLSTGCQPCNRQLAQQIQDWALLPLSLPRQLPPLRIERQLMQRIAGNEPVQVAAASSTAPVQIATNSKTAWRTRTMWAALAAAAGLAGVAAWFSWTGYGGGNGLLTEAEYRAELERRFAQADKSQHFSTIPQLTFAYVNRPKSAEPIHGYVVADDIARQWHVYTFNMPPLREGRIYQIWLVVNGTEFVPAGTCNLDSDGTATNLIDLPSDTSSITGIAISDEPAAGSLKPSGENLIKADLPIATP